MFAFGARMNVCRCSVSVRSLRDILSSNRPKIAYRSMASCTRDFNNETDNDECLKVYNYFFNPTLLQDKVAVITGGGSGIGFRLTEVFMRHGCKTAIASRRLEKVTEAAEKLSAATGMPCLPLQADVRKPQQVEAALDEVLKTYGRVDILVNNAAGNFLSPVENLSYNAFKTVIEIDTIGTFNSSKAVYEKYFKEHGGNIINISATLHYKGRVLQCHAGSAKAAVDAMTKHMAVEWGPRGVRVNSIAPGPIGGTVGMNKLGGKSPIASEMQRVIPLGRWGLKTEIADSALYLASDVSSYVTGHVMVVDGGEWLSSPNPPDLAAMLRPRM